MNEQERSIARDLVARARLERDPVFRIKAQRESGNVQQFQRPLSETPTPRELTVLTYMSRGLTLEMTAEAMYVSRETVKAHLRSARYRLGAKNTLHACCEALRRGLIA